MFSAFAWFQCFYFTMHRGRNQAIREGGVLLNFTLDFFDDFIRRTPLAAGHSLRLRKYKIK